MPAKVVARFGAMVVYEESGAIVYCVADGEACRLHKPSLEVEQPDPGRWPADYFDNLKAALDDPLAEQVLAAGEPDFPRVAALLPPLRDLGFLGEDTLVERFEVGRPATSSATTTSAVRRRASSSASGCSRASCQLRCTPTERSGAAGAAAGSGGRRREAAVVAPPEVGAGYGAIFRYTCDAEEVAPEDFYAALLSLWEQWERFRRQGVRLQPAGARPAGAGRAGHAAAGRADLPRAAAALRRRLLRRSSEHNSFPPATIFLVQALLAWGQSARAARRALSHYLSRYVKPDGTLDYYGPAVAEYGQVAGAGGRVRARWRRCANGCARRLTLLRPVWQRPGGPARGRASSSYPPGDPHHGLIPGLPESGLPRQARAVADASTTRATCGPAAGLREIGRAAARADCRSPLRREGRRSVAEAAGVSRRTSWRSLQQAHRGERGYVPAGAGPDSSRSRT